MRVPALFIHTETPELMQNQVSETPKCRERKKNTAVQKNMFFNPIKKMCSKIQGPKIRQIE